MSIFGECSREESCMRAFDKLCDFARKQREMQDAISKTQRMIERKPYEYQAIRYITDEEHLSKIQKMISEGLSYTAIAENIGFTPQQVQYFCSKRGIKSPYKPTRKKQNDIA